ncbi:MAG TPA: hypothetical protein PLZ51_07890, partial [Aggregatilineales bacterium]|nr:hypothetical protein [Aggregatilineales bacterium]
MYRLKRLFLPILFFALIFAVMPVIATQLSAPTRANPSALIGVGGEFGTISDDGRYVTFESDSPNLVPNDTNGVADIFVYDRQTAQMTRISVDSSGNQANNRSQYSQISGNGQFVMFDSYATNLVPNDTNNQPDIFVHDRITGQTTRVSVDSAGNQHEYLIPDSFPTYANWLSYDGRYVTFTSFADNLVAGNSGFI